MLKKPISLLTNFYHSFKDWQLFLFLFIISFFVRFPFFFRDYIDRDESTFILMAQSWVDGHLPYTELWDLKPPITFLYFAIIIFSFGKSFLAIRLSGVILVALTSFFTYKIGMTIAPKKVAFWSALALVALQSLFGSLQGVMSEHISIAFFTIGLYWFIAKKGIWNLFITGSFLGLALMTKLNMAYAVLFLFLFEVWESAFKRQIRTGIIKLSIIGGALLFIILLTCVPYYFKGEHLLWWKSVFEAPMAYSKGKSHSFLKVLPLVIIVLGFLFFASKKRLIAFEKKKIQVLVVVIIGVLMSFLQAGKANGHYLIQLYPSLVILVGITLDQAKFLARLNYKPFLLVFCLLLPIETYLELENIVKNKIDKGSFYNGEGIEVPKYFNKNQLDKDTVFFMEYHIGYWLLDSKPPTKAATHPSTILRGNLFPSMENTREKPGEELQFILEDVQPQYIVTRKNRRVFDKQQYTANFYINHQLLKNYQPLDTVDSAVIHQRLKIQ